MRDSAYSGVCAQSSPALIVFKFSPKSVHNMRTFGQVAALITCMCMSSRIVQSNYRRPRGGMEPRVGLSGVGNTGSLAQTGQAAAVKRALSVMAPHVMKRGRGGSTAAYVE